MAGLAWLSNPLAGTDFKDGVFGKSPFLGRKKQKNTCFRKNRYNRRIPTTKRKRIVENNDGISTNRQRDKRELK